MTIAEAAREVLRRNKRPMTIDEILNGILEAQLATFKSAQPRSVLRNQVRRHCDSIEHNAPAKLKLFVKIDDERYALLSN